MLKNRGKALHYKGFTFFSNVLTCCGGVFLLCNVIFLQTDIHWVLVEDRSPQRVLAHDFEYFMGPHGCQGPLHYPPDQRALLQSRARNLRQESSSPSHRSTALAQRRQLTTEGDYTVKALGTWMGGMVTESLTLLRQPPCVPQQAKQPLLMGERGRSQKVQL